MSIGILLAFSVRCVKKMEIDWADGVVKQPSVKTSI